MSDINKLLSSPNEFWAIDHVGEETAIIQRKIYKRTFTAYKMFIYAVFILCIFVYGQYFGTGERNLYYIQAEIFLHSPIYEILNVVMVLYTIYSFVYIILFMGLILFFLAFYYCQILMLNEFIKTIDFENIDQKENEEKTYSMLKFFVDYNNKIIEYVIIVSPEQSRK